MCEDVDKSKTLETSSQQKMINGKEVEILGIKIDQKLWFHQHSKSISKKAGQKLFFHIWKMKKVVYNTTIKSQCNYCPLEILST